MDLEHHRLVAEARQHAVAATTVFGFVISIRALASGRG